MAEDKLQLAFGDLFKSIVHEFSTALTLVKRSHPSVAVRSIRLHLGQLPEDEVETGPSLILPDRYPDIDKGWQLQLELGERPKASLRGVPIRLPSVSVPTVLDLFADQPLAAVKGIDATWSQRFAEFEILRVCHLVRLEEPLLHKLMISSHSLLPREFRQKTRLLKVPVPALPLPESPLGKVSLYKMLQMPTDQLHERLGRRKVSREEVVTLVELLDTLSIVIDSSLLRQTRFEQLIGG